MSRVIVVLLLGGTAIATSVAASQIDAAPGLIDWFSRAWDWLMLPLSGSTKHVVEPWASVHGRFMVFAWAILMPVGIIIARFYKITPGQDWPQRLDNPFWFYTHRVLDYGVGVVMTAAVVPVILNDPWQAPWRNFHTLTGWSVFLLGWVQIVGSLFRGTMGGPIQGGIRRALPPEQWRGDHFDMTFRRVFFEFTHKFLGYLLLALSIVAIVLGLLIADALIWMWLVLGVWWLGWAGLFAWMQRQGRCIDTYQAIWGIDESLSGNRRRPIGWGIRRYTEADLANAPWPRRRIRKAQ
jgi:hypothetical protein